MLIKMEKIFSHMIILSCTIFLWHNGFGYESEEDADEETEPCVDCEAHILGNELFIGLLECADQAGILGIVDISTGSLIHVQKAEYYLYGIPHSPKTR